MRTIGYFAVLLAVLTFVNSTIIRQESHEIEKQLKNYILPEDVLKFKGVK